MRAAQLPGVPEGSNALAMSLETDSRGTLWVGYEHGIAWLDNEDGWQRIETDQPVNSVRSMAVAPAAL